MNKASKSVSAMTDKVNQSKEAIAKISQTQNITISTNCNISETVNAAKSAINSLKHTIEAKELNLKGKVDLDGLESETINSKLTELGSYLEKNSGKMEEYTNKLGILKQRQNEFTDTTKGSIKLGVEQQIDSLEKKLAEIEAAKQQFAEWQQIRIDFNELEAARAELATVETALEELNRTNVAVRAYIDFKTDALKQVYDIDEKLKSFGKKIISPIIKLKDQATEKLKDIKTRASNLMHEKFAPVVNAVDKAKEVINSVKNRLAKVAGTIVYPVIKARDAASTVIGTVRSGLQKLRDKIITPEIRLKAQQAFNTLRQLSSKLGSLGRKAVSVASKFGKGIVAAVGTATTAVIGIGISSIKVGAQFEASMSQVAATMGMTASEANYTNKEYAMLANTAKEMGASTKFSASESAEALNYLALAGYDATKACQALPTVLKLAQAGGMDLAATSDMVTDGMSALGIEATNDNLTKFGDKLAKASQKSNTSVAQIGEAILTVGGTAKDLSSDIDKMTTSMATGLGVLADSGIKGSEGGTALRNIIESMIPKSDDAAAALKQLKVEPYQNGSLRDLSDIFTDLNKATENLTQETRKDLLGKIFNKTDLKSVSALMASTAVTTTQLKNALSNADVDVDNLGVSIEELASNFDKSQNQEEFAASAMKKFGINSEQAGVMYTGLMSVVDGSATRWNELSGYIADSDGAMNDMADTMNDNLQGRITEFKSAMESVQVAIYEAIGSSKLKDIVKEASGWLTDLKDATEQNGLNGLVKEFGVVFEKIIKKIVSLAPKLIKVGAELIRNLVEGITKDSSSIVNEILKIGTVLVKSILTLAPELMIAGGELFLQLAQGVKEKLPQIINSAEDATQGLAQNIADGLPILLEVGGQIILTLIDAIITSIPNLFSAATEIITSIGTFLINNIDKIIEAGLSLIQSLCQGIVNAIPTLIPIVTQLIQSFIQFLREELPNILLTAVEIVKTLAQGIIENLPELAQGAFQIIESLAGFIIENLPELLESGISLVGEIISGIISALPDLGEAALKLVKKIANKIKETDWLKIGKDIIAGIGNGIKKGVENIGSSIKSAGNAIVGKFKSTFGIHSPSRVMKNEIGFNLGAGVAEGIKDTKMLLTTEIKQLTNEMVIEFDSNAKKDITSKKDFFVLKQNVITPSYKEKMNSPKESTTYQDLEISKPIYQNKRSAVQYNNSTTQKNNNSEKKIYIENLIGKVVVQNEGDEEKLVQKILAALANDIEDTCENM